MDKLIVVILFAVFLVVIGPLLTIWSLNTLFPVLAIPYTFDTWAAVILLGLFIRAKVERS
jgi:hypothetical protein